MDKLNIILGICIVVCVIFSASLVLSAEPQQLFEVNVSAGGIPVSFLTNCNISDFHLDDVGEGYAYYYSDSDHVNLWVAKEDTVLANKIMVSKNRDVYNPQDVNGTLVYVTDSNTGSASGQTRYITFNIDNNSGLIVVVSSPSINETSFIMKHLEVKR